MELEIRGELYPVLINVEQIKYMSRLSDGKAYLQFFSEGERGNLITKESFEIVMDRIYKRNGFER